MKILMMGIILQALNICGACYLYAEYPFDAKEVIIFSTCTSYILGSLMGTVYALYREKDC